MVADETFIPVECLERSPFESKQALFCANPFFARRRFREGGDPSMGKGLKGLGLGRLIPFRGDDSDARVRANPNAAVATFQQGADLLVIEA